MIDKYVSSLSPPPSPPARRRRLPGTPCRPSPPPRSPNHPRVSTRRKAGSGRCRARRRATPSSGGATSSPRGARRTPWSQRRASLLLSSSQPRVNNPIKAATPSWWVAGLPSGVVPNNPPSKAATAKIPDIVSNVLIVFGLRRICRCC